MNTFKGANLEFPNRTIHALLAEIIKFRKQLTVRNEFKAQSGWNDAMNRYMVVELNKLRDTIENISYNPANATQEEREASVSDTSASLENDYDERAIAADNVLGPGGPQRTVHWDLSGSNPEIPQLTPETCPNDFARMFVTGLDDLFVAATRLDSRFETNNISKYESVILVDQFLEPLYSITQRKGGELNRSDIPTGTLPNAEPNTFAG